MRLRVIARRSPVACPNRRARTTTCAAARRLRRGLIVPAAALLLAALPAGAQAGTGVAACAARLAEPGSHAAPTLRAALRCAVNAERSSRGLAALRNDRRLGRAARRHARDMVRRGYFAHERPGWTLAGRLAAAGWSGGGAAEAIAWGCGGRGSALATLQSWLESPPHRAIVLGSYTRAGIGLALGAPGQACAAGGTWVIDVGR